MPRARRLTAEEAAERLGLSVSRVAELARNRDLGRKEGGRWSISEADVARVARGSSVGSPSTI
jgi:excisionase family DNA binding protein